MHSVAILAYDGMSGFETGLAAEIFGITELPEMFSAGIARPWYSVKLCAEDAEVRDAGRCDDAHPLRPDRPGLCRHGDHPECPRRDGTAVAGPRRRTPNRTRARVTPGVHLFGGVRARGRRGARRPVGHDALDLRGSTSIALPRGRCRSRAALRRRGERAHQRGVRRRAGPVPPHRAVRSRGADRQRRGQAAGDLATPRRRASPVHREPRTRADDGWPDSDRNGLGAGESRPADHARRHGRAVVDVAAHLPPAVRQRDRNDAHQMAHRPTDSGESWTSGIVVAVDRADRDAGRLRVAGDLSSPLRPRHEDNAERLPQLLHGWTRTQRGAAQH